MIFVVGERLHRSHDDAIARMDADRIDIFHVADDDGVVVGVAHHFVFDFFIAGDALLDQALMDGRDLEARFANFTQFFFIVGKSATRSS